jgi:hypothetical protein
MTRRERRLRTMEICRRVFAGKGFEERPPELEKKELGGARETSGAIPGGDIPYRSSPATLP